MYPSCVSVWRDVMRQHLRQEDETPDGNAKHPESSTGAQPLGIVVGERICGQSNRRRQCDQGEGNHQRRAMALPQRFEASVSDNDTAGNDEGHQAEPTDEAEVQGTQLSQARFDEECR